jgi:hypothetical protein
MQRDVARSLAGLSFLALFAITPASADCAPGGCPSAGPRGPYGGRYRPEEVAPPPWDVPAACAAHQAIVNKDVAAGVRRALYLQDQERLNTCLEREWPWYR